MRMRVTRVEKVRPPIMLIPSGLQNSDPSLLLNAIGIMPRIVVMVVMRMGRSRFLPDIFKASIIGVPRRLGQNGKPLGVPDEFRDRLEDQRKDQITARHGDDDRGGAEIEELRDRLDIPLYVAGGDPVGDDYRQEGDAAEDDRDQNIGTDAEVFPFHYLTILVMSHMGRKIARAKKPTTAARPTIRIGPRASESPLTA